MFASNPLLRGGWFALVAALAFGLTTPLIQRFGRGVGPRAGPTSFGWGALAVLLATVGWAVDNTLTRPLAEDDR